LYKRIQSCPLTNNTFTFLLLVQALKKISYSGFCDALLLLAKTKGCSVAEVQQVIAAVGGPGINSSSNGISSSMSLAMMTAGDKDTVRSKRRSESNH
jgi:hypothetical protein